MPVFNSLSRIDLCQSAVFLMSVVAILFVFQPVMADTREAVSFISDYCIDCHMADNAEGGIELDGFDSESDMVGAGKMLLRALDAVDQQVMPPKDALQPSATERAKFVDWIRDKLLARDCGEDRSSAAVVIRRLNRQEYDNTLRDLLGVPLQLSQDFPADDSGFGFDNIGSVLNTSPVHVERYLMAAEKALQATIRTPDVGLLPPVELIGLRTYPLAADGEVKFAHRLKPGRYLVDFSLVRAGISETAPTPSLKIGFGSDSRIIAAAKVQDETVVYKFWINVFESDEQVRVAVAREPGKQANELNQQVGQNVSGDKRYGSNVGLHVDSMVVRGPVQVAIEDKSATHEKIFACKPSKGDDRLACGRKIVERFATSAFRRPAKDEEVDRLMRLFEHAIRQGESLEAAVQITLSGVLVSPQFLFLVEPEHAETDRRLTEYELASRLSYFLWSSMPDKELFAAASEGTVRSNLNQHVSRMLADSKSSAFVENFVGQWLQLRNLAHVVPDPSIFPSFSDELAESMRTETEAFFSHVLKQNGSVLQLLDANYTFLNETLARHYGIADVRGPEFRLVRLGRSNRGGLLTQASILSITSHHNRTSPVKRGQWILQQILGTPPPPPPPNVEQLDESDQAAKTGSLRDRLELHRSSPECAACHNQMDPLGFGLENFDAIGGWRDNDGDFPIDASGVLPGNRKFDGVSEMKSMLVSTGSRRFSWCLIENLLVYGLGRSLEPEDYCTVEAIRKRLVKNDFKIQEIILAIVESKAFQYRGVSR